MMTMSHVLWDKGSLIKAAHWWRQPKWQQRFLRFWWEDFMVCIWRCNRCLVWHHWARTREMGPSPEKQIRRSTCLQKVTWPRWIKTAKWKRSRVFQEYTETTLCESSSDSISVSNGLDEMDDKIPNRWKKTCWIMDGSLARSRSYVTSCWHYRDNSITQIKLLCWRQMINT